MNKITKKTIKRIKSGYHSELMDAIEYLIDIYNEDKFDSGYQSCLEDLSVRAQNLAKKLGQEADKRGKFAKDKNDEPISYLEFDETVEVIKQYFTKALKEE